MVTVGRAQSQCTGKSTCGEGSDFVKGNLRKGTFTMSVELRLLHPLVLSKEPKGSRIIGNTFHVQFSFSDNTFVNGNKRPTGKTGYDANYRRCDGPTGVLFISTSWQEGSIWIGSTPKKVDDFTSLDSIGQKVVQYIHSERENLMKEKLQLEQFRQLNETKLHCQRDKDNHFQMQMQMKEKDKLQLERGAQEQQLKNRNLTELDLDGIR